MMDFCQCICSYFFCYFCYDYEIIGSMYFEYCGINVISIFFVFVYVGYQVVFEIVFENC